MDHYQSIYFRIVDAFDKDKTAIQFLREDGEGGFSSGIYRMAREIDRLNEKVAILEAELRVAYRLPAVVNEAMDRLLDEGSLLHSRKLENEGK